MIAVDTNVLVQTLNRPVAAGRDLTPAMRKVGKDLLNTTPQRFGDEKAPDGTPWAPRSEYTPRRKKCNRDKILTESGTLRILNGHLAEAVG